MLPRYSAVQQGRRAARLRENSRSLAAGAVAQHRLRGAGGGAGLALVAPLRLTEPWKLGVERRDGLGGGFLSGPHGVAQPRASGDVATLAQTPIAGASAAPAAERFGRLVKQNGVRRDR
jgi:hypothetical protein